MCSGKIIDELQNIDTVPRMLAEQAGAFFFAKIYLRLFQNG